MIKKLGSVLSKTFMRTMVLLALFGVGLWFLAQIIAITGRSSATAPIGTVTSRFRQFATTGS